MLPIIKSMTIRKCLLGLALIFLVACQPLAQTAAVTNVAPTDKSFPPTTVPIATETVPVFVGVPTLAPISKGPEGADFPKDVNPITGQIVEDPGSLGIPAALISISNSPITARPQAGVSFASQVIELFIGEGTTRFLAVFYGDMPRRVSILSSALSDEKSILERQASTYAVTGRVWLDENKNETIDPWEKGLGGIVVKVLDASGKQIIKPVTTDSNGYYGVPKMDPGKGYRIHFETTGLQTTKPVTLQFDYAGNLVQGVDLPIIPPLGKLPVAASDIAPARTYVGPIRSGRLTYDDFNRMYPGSCLVFASAGEGILDRLKPCLVNYGAEDASSPNTSILDVSKMIELSKQSKAPNAPVNYSGNLFSEITPQQGKPALVLDDVFHQFAQSRWVYDPFSKNYLRYTDAIDGSGVFHADSDRLTGRQIGFENVIILLANYSVFRHGQYDVDLCCGLEGYAYLFRDGQMFRIRWNTNNREWEQTQGYLRPIKFVGEDKMPIALRPGRTWIALMTPNSAVFETANGHWRAEFAMPDDTAPLE